MQYKTKFINRSGQELDLIYYEGVDPMQDLEGKVFQAAHAFCFYNNKLVLVRHKDHGWQPPGGGIEEGETYEQATVREVQEETNMKVLYQELVGFVDIYEPKRIIRQTRSFCMVEPYGDFVADPDEDITEIKLINPKDYKKYFDWGDNGDLLIKKVFEMKNKYDRR